MAYTKVATNVPSVSWVPRARMKLRSILGPNCWDASVRATMVTEKITPSTVMIPAASALSSCRAPSALSSRTHAGKLS